MSEHIQFGVDDEGIATVIFDRPQRKNAFDTAMYLAATEAIRRTDESSRIRVLVLRGAGGAFTAGHDLDDFRDREAAPEERAVFVFLTSLHELDKPVLAAVDGPAYGLGTALLLYCDLVFATRRSRFRLPFVSLGLSPAGGTSFLLPRRVGLHRASEILMLGDVFDAETAYRDGLVNEVVEGREALDALVAKRSLSLARQPATSLQYAKRLLRADERKSLRVAMMREGERFEERVRGPALQVALEAFARREVADFRGVD
jgi:enoyl-CoA hydratase/carnithine racemase